MITPLPPNTVRWWLLVLRFSPVNTTLALQSFRPDKYHLENRIHISKIAYVDLYYELITSRYLTGKVAIWLMHEPSADISHRWPAGLIRHHDPYANQGPISRSWTK